MDLRTARKAKGWTLQRVASLIGVKSAMTVSRHERGIDYPRPKIMARYAAIYDGLLDHDDVIETHQKANS